ncbi:hypothetical protein [Leptospira mtsangambouensis]|uniref:hypothetical protein n=1 Tax=Leptospira mtsangambouensis TaxID=2484912 RepID=UPI001EEB3D8F|nr:hypothetical protein [Leptospira mtsangambouensis]MCG6142671.1 hypothetical protein [Leptospira mtsangambouensis]
MRISKKTAERLRNLINEETEYRSGPQLVDFFNQLGSRDYYGQGFPSRWKYTDEKISQINGTPELDKCIKILFAPINFVGRIADLDIYINDFNQYLAFDNWKVERKGKEITFAKTDKIDSLEKNVIQNEDEFLNREISNINIEGIGLDHIIIPTLKERIEEIKLCLSAKASLSVIFLAGSTLEGILLGIALKRPKEFNLARSAPKDKDGKVRNFPDWTLSNFIDVSYEISLIKEDVKKFSHSLKDFRNYIHPYEQMSSKFSPDEHTAKICFQVLKAAISQLSK